MAKPLIFFIFLATFTETLAIFYSYFIGNMIEFLQSTDKNKDLGTSLIYVLIFGSAQFFSLILR